MPKTRNSPFGAMGGVKRVDFLSVDQEHAPFGGNVPKPAEFLRPASACHVFGEGESGKPGACGSSDQILVFDKGTAGVSGGYECEDQRQSSSGYGVNAVILTLS